MGRPVYLTKEIAMLRYKEQINKHGPFPCSIAINQYPEIAGTRCWLWTGSVFDTGYGQFSAGILLLNERLVHRFASKLANPKLTIHKRLICHKCDTRLCVRPLHLFRGTYQLNTMDMYNKGRGKTHPGEAHHNAKLTDKVVYKILRLLSKGIQGKDLSVRFDITASQISCIRNGTAWKHIYAKFYGGEYE